MATGITALERTLIGVESSADTHTTDTPTTHWRGTGKIRDTEEVMFPAERVGIFGGTTRSYIPAQGAEIPLEGEATYEQLPYIFGAGVHAATPTTDSGSGYIWTYNVQSVSSDNYATTDLNTLVVQSGDNMQVLQSRFVFIREMTISGRQGEALMLASIGQGRAPTTDGFAAVATTDLQNPAEIILFSKGIISIDPSSDTIGTTQVSETLLDASLSFRTGWVAIEARDGRLDFSNIKRTDDEMTLEVTFEHNGIAIAELAAKKAQTERAIQLKFTGAALTSAGAYTYKTFIMNLWGKWSAFGAQGLEEQNGDNIYRGTFNVRYSPTAGNKAQFIVVNELDTLP
jgi:hypothetical protein